MSCETEGVGFEPATTHASSGGSSESPRIGAHGAAGSREKPVAADGDCSNVATVTEDDVPALRDAFVWLRDILGGGGE